MFIAATTSMRSAGERAGAGRVVAAAHGAGVLMGGTDEQCDLRESLVDGIGCEARLASIGVTVRRLPMPFDPRPHIVSTARIGTRALASRGLRIEDFARVGRTIAEAVEPYGLGTVTPRSPSAHGAIAERDPLNTRPDDSILNEDVVLSFLAARCQRPPPRQAGVSAAPHSATVPRADRRPAGRS